MSPRAQCEVSPRAGRCSGMLEATFHHVDSFKRIPRAFQEPQTIRHIDSVKVRQKKSLVVAHDGDDNSDMSRLEPFSHIDSMKRYRCIGRAASCAALRYLEHERGPATLRHVDSLKFARSKSTTSMMARSRVRTFVNNFIGH
eukprot:TRINITY_DN30395_c0_g1_i1.p1 TRINITY_DN30395_c0_g1~~TRINITY_DN30395_c0_g1_i1.p1  ORF type:complete len:142 (-),score=9.29 TRINITY_DN30395_c0_g1_i1:352-777(-)